jgi:hypothetical protein
MVRAGGEEVITQIEKEAIEKVGCPVCGALKGKKCQRVSDASREFTGIEGPAKLTARPHKARTDQYKAVLERKALRSRSKV